MFIGRNIGIMYGTESVWGTAVAATTPLGGKVTNFSATKNNNLISERGLGDGRNVQNFIYGGFDVSGSISWNVGDFDFFKYAVGQRSGAGTSGSPYILTEGSEFNAGDIDSFTMIVNKEDGSSDQEDTYTGCIITDLTINGTETGVVTATANFVAKSISTDTSLASAYTPSTLAPWIGVQGALSWGASPSAVAKIATWSVTLNNNPAIYRSLGSRFIEQPVAGERGYAFTTTIRTSQTILTTLISDFLGDASSPYTPNTATASAEPTTSLEFKIVLTGASDRTATIQLDEAVLNTHDEPVNIGNDVMQTTFNGFAKEGKSNQPFTWVL